jgi:hypothetical protein
MGMRKDLILSQEEIQRRKDSGRNRNISSTIELTNSLPNSEPVLPIFDEIDRVNFSNIENIYQYNLIFYFSYS